MSEACRACGRELDPAHDARYDCPECREPSVLFCPGCCPRPDRCPRCGAGLDYHEASITKKAFFNPATRNGLGF